MSVAGDQLPIDIFQVPRKERILKVRAHCTTRTMGSRNLPKTGEARPLSEQASSSSKMLLSTALRSPRTPAPLLLNTWATRPTYAGLGLLVTMRWINWRAKKGATLG